MRTVFGLIFAADVCVGICPAPSEAGRMLDSLFGPPGSSATSASPTIERVIALDLPPGGRPVLFMI